MNLHEILVCFNSPIKEEQAWAVCYLCCKFLKSKEAEQRSLPSGPKFIEFDKDGNVTISATSTSSHDEIEVSPKCFNFVCFICSSRAVVLKLF